MTRLKRYVWPIVVCLSIAIYAVLAKQSIRDSEGYRIPPLKYLFPNYASQLLSFGDPYLAANINYARVVTLFHYSKDNIEPRSKLLLQSMELNAKHLDGIYQAAVLPWEGQVDRGIEALNLAVDGRYWDWAPPLMLGVTELNFKDNYIYAAELIGDAARKVTNEKRKKYYSLLAAQTHSRGGSVELSLAYIEGLISSVKQESLKAVLEERAQRLRTLIMLREAAVKYEQRFDRKLESLDELVSSAILSERPKIYGMGYSLDENGMPELYEKVHARAKR